MARKTLGKMEFESLVKSLQEQNKGHIAAQQETTKSIRNALLDIDSRTSLTSMLNDLKESIEENYAALMLRSKMF